MSLVAGWRRGLSGCARVFSFESLALGGLAVGIRHARPEMAAGGDSLIFNWYIKQTNRLHNLRTWPKQASKTVPGDNLRNSFSSPLSPLFFPSPSPPRGINFYCAVYFSSWKIASCPLQRDHFLWGRESDKPKPVVYSLNVLSSWRGQRDKQQCVWGRYKSIINFILWFKRNHSGLGFSNSPGPSLCCLFFVLCYWKLAYNRMF